LYNGIVPSPHGYIYGVQDAEIERLAMQHRLWADDCLRHCKRAGFRPGQTLLDIGCGPGFAAWDLAELVGPKGQIIAIEREAKYADFFRQELSLQHRRPRAPIDLRITSAQTPGLAASSLDGAYARWFFTFIPDLSEVLRPLQQALRVNAPLVILDYFDWAALAWGPRQETLPLIREGVTAAFDSFGADGCVGQALPSALTAAGFELIDMQPRVHMARPQHALWSWPQVWLEGFLPTVIEAGHLPADILPRWQQEWAHNAQDPVGYFMSPPQVELIARRKRTGGLK